MTATILAVLTILTPAVGSWAMSTFAAHDHGRLDVVIDGELLDLDQPRYHDLHPQFHVHPGHGNRTSLRLTGVSTKVASQDGIQVNIGQPA